MKLDSSIAQDIIAGSIVFLIALPLSLSIALASDVPPIAGIFAAICGGLWVSRLSGAHLTINGPAAGLIIIIASGVAELGHGDAMLGYTSIIAAVAIAGGLLMLLGFFKLGRLGDLFPLSAVHGMLSAIGIIIMSKQLHTMLGVVPKSKTPLALLAEVPSSILSLNPEIATIGILSVLVMVLFPMFRWTRRLPAPIVVVLLGIWLGVYFDLEHQHMYLFPLGHPYEVGPRFLVTLPGKIWEGIQFPNWSLVTTWPFWKIVLTLAAVQALETMLSASAVDKLDPYKRTSNLNRDLVAVGSGSMISGMIGGLPIIAEIVRSSANISNGARTQWSNFFHGVWMLVFVAFFPDLLHHIPLASLGAILVVTGYRLASPSQFQHAFAIGREQLLIFVSTVWMTLTTDLILGVLTGVGVKVLIHWIHGANLRDLFKPDYEVIQNSPGETTFRLNGPLVFSNYLAIVTKIEHECKTPKRNIDFGKTPLVDHTVLTRLTTLQEDLARKGVELSLVGMNGMLRESTHEHGVRRRIPTV